jgi:outer membrane protein assembly factor BamB
MAGKRTAAQSAVDSVRGAPVDRRAAMCAIGAGALAWFAARLVHELGAQEADVSGSVQKGGDWPQFLGPGRSGVSGETGLNFDWAGREPKLLWRQPLGQGFSSVSVVGDRLFTQCQREDKQYVVCLDAKSGEEIWTRFGEEGFLDKQRQGPGPRATPTWHDRRLYCLFPAGELLCLEADSGEVVWQTNILEETRAGDHGDLEYYWGMSASPLVEEDQVIVQPGGRGAASSLVSFDLRTGRVVWGVGSDPPGYGAPIAVTAAGRRQVIGSTGTSIIAADLRRGEPLWRYEWGNRFNCNCATPLWLDGRLFLSSSYGTGAALLELVEEDGKPAVREVWTNRNFQNQFATSAVHQGFVYGPHGDVGGATFRCIALETGEVKWTARGPGKCTLLFADGHIIALGESGTLYLIEPNSEKYMEKAKLEGLLRYKAWSPPSLSRGMLYLRDERDVICVELRKAD